MTFEKISDPKFEGLKKDKISNLAAIVGGTGKKVETGRECTADYSYDTGRGVNNDNCWTTVKSGDTAEVQGGPCR
ncbi:MAG: hypothetical protein WCM76_05015 [Bacteroidota bacterium]